MRLSAAVFICFSAAPVWADCAVDQTLFLGCHIEGRNRVVSVCYDQSTAVYTYGAPGQIPELTLREDIATLDYAPWPGVGRAIWETVTFHNGDYSYSVTGGFDRMPSDDPDADVETTSFGGVMVSQDGAVISDLTCATKGLAFEWADTLFAAKTATGATYDPATQSWSQTNK